MAGAMGRSGDAAGVGGDAGARDATSTGVDSAAVSAEGSLEDGVLWSDELEIAAADSPCV